MTEEMSKDAFTPAEGLEKIFTPSDFESDLIREWIETQTYKSSVEKGGKPYSIMFPPPNVTGKLHIGHALTFTLQDILIRAKRKEGYNVLWQAGTDHAGIATQVLIEKQLEQENNTRENLGREKFLERVWAWKEESGGIIIDQLKRLGASADWSRERFTMDEGLSNAVIEAFVQLYKDGLIYRDYRLVNWDCTLKSAVSDIEVENRNLEGKLYYLRYPLEQGGFLTVATTRPETLFGDMALAVHPEDERYQKYIGQYAKVPFLNRHVPIVADEHSDPEKGTGVVKITPAHDFNDFEVGKRHQLEMPIILDSSGKFSLKEIKVRKEIADPWVEEAEGLSVMALRERVVDALEKLSLLEKIEKHPHAVPHSERTGTIIEPRLTMQWYCDAPKMAKKAVKSVQDGEIAFEPKQWENTYFAWMKELQPWCISRQLWWGHQIPAWYDTQGHIYVAKTEEKAQRLAGENVTLTRDPDVLDTWFSSALWPFATLGWPEKTEAFEFYYPTSVLVTGFDIIFFWVSRMMMMGLYFTKKPPFKTIVIHGLVRDEHGQKMSKSKGNGVDPLEIIEKYGADALRLTLCAGVTLGRDIRISDKIVEDHRNFITKLWNVARFLQMNGVFEQKQQNSLPQNLKNNALDSSERQIRILKEWIEDSFQQSKKEAFDALEKYRFADYAQICMHFVRDCFCDWFVELSKPLLNRPSEASETFREFCKNLFKRILNLLEPVIPFVTTHLLQKLFVGVGQTDLTSSTKEEENRVEASSESKQEIDWLISLISACRTIRSEMNVPPANKGELILLEDEHISLLKERMKRWEEAIDRMGRISEIQVVPSKLKALETAAEFNVSGSNYYLPLKGLVDLSKERDRLEKEYSTAEAEFQKTQLRLANEKFIERAKPEIVAENKQRLEHLEKELKRLSLAIKRVEKLIS